MQLPSQELHVTVNSEAKNMASVMFFKTMWLVKASGHFDYFRQAVPRQFMVLLCIFLCLELGHYLQQLFGGLLQRLFPVKLQQCFED